VKTLYYVAISAKERTLCGSSICQKAEWDSGHKYVCAPTLEEMLMLKFELEKPRGHSCWLSSEESTFSLRENGEWKYFETSLIHETQYGNKKICVCCGNDVARSDVRIDRMLQFEKDSITVQYHRCEGCHFQRKIICHTTFCEMSKCARLNKMKLIYFWLFASQKDGEFIMLPKDIVLIISDLYSRLVCC